MLKPSAGPSGVAPPEEHGPARPWQAADLLRRYQAVRACTDELTAPLAPEDCVIQSMPDASPTRWHMAHVTWFFEALVLVEHAPRYRRLNEQFNYLFNSYYNSIGQQFPRADRGLLSRPTVAEVRAYRAHVDEHMAGLLEGADEATLARVGPLIEIGLNHEQQHQELLLTDIKHLFSCNPLYPVYHERQLDGAGEAPRQRWASYAEGLRWIGYDGAGFCYDNERPRRRVFVEAFELACRLVTNTEYQAFIADGGYRRPELWLSDGWAAAQARGWQAPLYWQQRDGAWWSFTLSGLRPVQGAEPVCHVSHYEADAFARWSGARLPTEAEWEHAAAEVETAGAFVEDQVFHPRVLQRPLDNATPAQMFGDVWEWTASPYVGYPGYKPLPGALGEYNGKFMSGQMTLRGGSCATSRTHIRPTYRNFFPPDARWQFSGIRLAK